MKTLPIQSLVRLLQLASPTLPVGAYTYSQGLEWAVESGLVRGEAGVRQWIGDLLNLNVARFEAPLFLALMKAWREADIPRITHLNVDFLASRESAELRAETVQMGYSLTRLLLTVHPFCSMDADRIAEMLRMLAEKHPLAFPTVWTAAAVQGSIEEIDALAAYLWAWLENMVMAAVKIVPLGQSDGQRLLAQLGAQLPGVVEQALTRGEPDWSNWSPGFALCSVQHETQYTRLFRS